MSDGDGPDFLGIAAPLADGVVGEEGGEEEVRQRRPVGRPRVHPRREGRLRSRFEACAKAREMKERYARRRDRNAVKTTSRELTVGLGNRLIRRGVSLKVKTTRRGPLQLQVITADRKHNGKRNRITSASMLDIAYHRPTSVSALTDVFDCEKRRS